jgi:ParB family chromosome partitioning protein
MFYLKCAMQKVNLYTVREFNPEGNLSQERVSTNRDANSIHIDLRKNIESRLLLGNSATAVADVMELRKWKSNSGRPLSLLINATNVNVSERKQRHDASYASKAYIALKDSILSTKGNQQPILIRIVEMRLEVVFGHRRQKACLELELPLLAMVWNDEPNEVAAFTCLERENEFHANRSVYERGCLFKALVDSNIFSSYRELANHIGKSHTLVNAVVRVAALHELVINAFGDPCSITTKHAEKIMDAWPTEKAHILARAEILCKSPPEKNMTPKKVLEFLLPPKIDEKEEFPLIMESPELGVWGRTAEGHIFIRLPATTSPGTINDIGQLVKNASHLLESNQVG